MSRRPASTPWSCAWSATGTVSVVVPSSSRVRSSSPSQADQWSSRWPSTRIAYVVGAVLMTALPAAPRRPVRDARAATRGPADRPLGDGQVDHPAGALGEVAGEHAGAEDRPAEALGERPGCRRPGRSRRPRIIHARWAAMSRRRTAAKPRTRQRGHRGRRRPGGARTAGRRCRAAPRRTASSTAPRPPPAGPATASTRPARRCQARCRRRNRGTNWKASRRARTRRADDVHHEREREAGEPVVGGHDGRAAGQLDQPQRAGGQRDRAERDQRRPAPASSAARVLIGPRRLGEPRRRPAASTVRPTVGAGRATGRRRGRSARCRSGTAIGR